MSQALSVYLKRLRYLYSTRPFKRLKFRGARRKGVKRRIRSGFRFEVESPDVLVWVEIHSNTYVDLIRSTSDAAAAYCKLCELFVCEE